MSTLLQSIADRWSAADELNALLPIERVFTGRVPSTEEVRTPYVSVTQGASRSLYRTDKTQVHAVTINFDIWTDDTKLADAERIDAAIVAAMADSSWSYDTGFGQGAVLDVIDEGPSHKQQVHSATYKAWQAVKVMTFIVERQRAHEGS